ncbi:MAG: hypothetical protein IJS56_01935 [Bacilli bacterium]|nr:hypothetical protein [Bacilli bacterium]
MTEVGNIVTLDDNKEYLILEEQFKDDVRYLYAVRVLIDDTLTDEFTIFKTIKKDNSEFLLPVDDKTLYDELAEGFLDIASEKLMEIDKSELEEGSNE